VRVLQLLTAIVPVHNEERGIAAFLQSLASTLSELAPRFEIVVVNDGSTDGTATQIARVSSQCCACYLELARRFGQDAALSAGMQAAQGDCVILISPTGRHPIEAIPEMVALWGQGYQMVYGIEAPDLAGPTGGTRLIDVAGWLHPRAAWRSPVRHAFQRLLNRLSEVTIPADASDFRLLDRVVLDAIRRLPERSRFMRGLYAWAGFRTVGVKLPPTQPVTGRDSRGIRELSDLAITAITAFSSTPLRLASFAGLIVSALAIAFAGYILLEWLIWGQAIPGFETLALSVLLLSGLQLLAIGVVGEYVGRIFVEVKRRPNYIVSETVDSRDAAPAEEDGAESVLPPPRIASVSGM
jgi:glycosyltransferase involved in cell wall biosynthesis